MVAGMPGIASREAETCPLLIAELQEARPFDAAPPAEKLLDSMPIDKLSVNASAI
jgi:hypothetical protein